MILLTAAYFGANLWVVPVVLAVVTHIAWRFANVVRAAKLAREEK